MNQSHNRFINSVLIIILLALCGLIAWNMYYLPDKPASQEQYKQFPSARGREEVLSRKGQNVAHTITNESLLPLSEEALQQIPEETVQEEITTGEPVQASIPADEKPTDEGLILEDDPVPAQSSADKYPLLPTTTNQDPEVLKIGFITDLHIKTSLSGSTRQITPKYRDKIYYFNSQMARSFAPDFILINGDTIEGTDQPAAVGIEELQLTKKEFDVTGIPKYWVLGNHELRSVTKLQYKNALGINYTNVAFDSGDYRIIILDSNFDASDGEIVPGHQYLRGNVPNWEREWLRGQLSSTNKTKVVFMHHPPLQELDSKRKVGLLFRAELMQKIFESNDVKAVFSGHVEVLFKEKVGGVRYYGLPGLAKHTSYQGAFATIEIKDDKVTVKMTYLDNEGKYRTVDVK